MSAHVPSFSPDCNRSNSSDQLSLIPSAGREMSSSLRATGWRHSVAVWVGGILRQQTADPFLPWRDNGWLHSALRYHQLMPISCHFRHCKALLVANLTHVRSAIAKTRPLPLTTFLMPDFASIIAVNGCVSMATTRHQNTLSSEALAICVGLTLWQWKAVMLNAMFQCLTWPLFTTVINTNRYQNWSIAGSLDSLFLCATFYASLFHQKAGS